MHGETVKLNMAIIFLPYSTEYCGEEWWAGVDYWCRCVKR